LIVENDTRNGSYQIFNQYYFTSFKIINNCNLSNVSFELYNTDPDFVGSVKIYILSSEWNETLNRSIPYFNNNVYENYLGEITNIPISTLNWFNLTNINYYLNNSKTQNNTWFIGLFEPGTENANVQWCYVNDDNTGDNDNESYSYQHISGTNWQYFNVDLKMKIGLEINKSASPSEINLKLNNNNIQDNINEKNAGYIKLNDPIAGVGGKIDFNLIASWYLYTFQINETIINYTKSDIYVITNFTANSSNDIYWTSYVEISQFESSFENFQINFSISIHWNAIDVKNESESKSFTESIIENNKIISITSNASNGNWTLYCSSPNLLTDLKFFVNNNERSIVISNEIVDFNVSFSDAIIGNINLSIYEPEPSVNLNFSKVIEISSPSKDIYLGNWNISSTITSTGSFRVQVTWNNETDAAIIERELVVLKQTEVVIEPLSGYENSSLDPFNISITYKDLFSAGIPNITGATIGYNISGSWVYDSTQNNPDQKYNITIDPKEYSIGTHIFAITINKTGYQSHSIEFIYNSVEGTVIQPIEYLIKIDNVIRGQNASFYFNYTKAGSGIENGLIKSISINSSLEWSYIDLSNGNYVININTSRVNVGNYNCRFRIEHLPDQSQIIEFTIQIIQPNTKLILINQTTSIWRLSGENITVFFKFNDTDNNELISGIPPNCIFVYNGSNPSQLWDVGSFNFFSWEEEESLYGVNISINNLNKGNYSAIISVNFEPNYKIANLTIDFYIRGNFTSFKLESVSKYQNFELLIEENGYAVYPGTKGMGISFKILDSDNYDKPVNFENINFTINITINYLNNLGLNYNLSFDPQNKLFSGYIEFPENLPLGSYLITIEIKIDNYENIIHQFNLSVIEKRGIPEWVLILIILSFVAISSIIGIQQGVIKPRKRKYQEKIINTASIFEDAINMQHILVIYKETGTCVYFKTLSMEEIDPNLISGFLTATQSFAKESTKIEDFTESEMKYGDYHFLISDGELIRVTLVLNKPASKFLKSNLKRFVLMFESKYREVLQNWKGQLNVFKNAGQLADEILHTSIILPHEITTDINKIKKLKSPLSKALLKIARDFTTGSKTIFFLGQVIDEAKRKIKKKPQEILLGIDEILKNGVFIPVDISKLEQVPISEQEIQLLAQKISEIPNFTDEEKQNLVKDLIEMTPAEREAAIYSLQSGKQITSEVSKKAVKTKTFINVKDAKAEINNLFKQSKKYIKQKMYSKAIECYEIAEVTASQWNLGLLAKQARNLVLNTQINLFNYQIQNAKKKIPKLIKQNKLNEAEQLKNEALEAASSMFKLGFNEYDKDIRYFNKLIIKSTKEPSETPVVKSISEDKNKLIKKQKELIKLASKEEKNKNYGQAIDYYSQLITIADNLFKMGVISASDDIKSYKSKISELKSKIKESEDIDEESLNDQKTKMLNIALEAEKEGDNLKAIVAYQQVINIYKKLGEIENAIKLDEKVKSIINSIKNIDNLIQSIINGAEEFYKNGKFTEAFPQYQYAKALCQAINDSENLKKIQSRLDEISSKF